VRQGPSVEELRDYAAYRVDDSLLKSVLAGRTTHVAQFALVALCAEVQASRAEKK
jgi:hypothetical protein